jgi:signal peptidase II
MRELCCPVPQQMRELCCPVPQQMRDNGAVTAADPDSVPAAHPIQPPAPRRVVLFAAVAVGVLVLDIVSKAIVVAQLSNRAPVRLLDGAVYLLETRNSGAAFSVGTGATLVLTIVALVVVAVIARAARRMRSVGWAIALGLILGGALGNLTDRLVRAPGIGRGHVVDWISLFSSDGHIWPIFNIADSAITCGAVTAGVVAVLGIELDGTRRR